MTVLIPALAALGCSDGQAVDDRDGQAGEAPDAGAGPGQRDGAAALEGGLDAQAQSDSGLDAGADASDTADDRLQPFEVGRRWTYTRTLFDPTLDAGCPGPLESYVAGTVERDGEVGWDYRPTCLDAAVQMFLDGDDIWAYVGDNPARTQYASAPVEEGTTWRIGSITFAWEEQGSIEVPAGTFDRCFRRVHSLQPDGGYIVLCRGVGVVVTHNPYENHRLELSEKNF